MSKVAQNILKKYYGYDQFREGQEQVIESILNGKDTFAIMPTGAGKSLCYQIPAMIFDGITLVISPLISLMKDQVDALRSTGIEGAYINSTLDFTEVEEVLYRARKGEVKLLYVAPERLESESFSEVLKTLDISFLAVDEAHCVSQWGHDFRTSYRKIAPFIKNLPKRPIVAAFTATATETVKDDVVKLLSLEKSNVYVTGFDRKNLSFTVLRGENKKDFILRYVEENKGQSGIIYAATRKEVEAVSTLLKGKGYSAGKYHAGLSDVERTKSQEAFIYDDVNIMVATNAFGMGIDKSNVRYVIHHNLPKNMEAYYQEAGRAGRDGEKSECILLFSTQDILMQKFLIEQGTSFQERRENEYKKLQEVVDYCHTSKCLRKYILEYFGEKEVPDQCENCSNCNDDSELEDNTVEAQKIFSCIYRMNQRYGTTLVAEVIRGSKNKKVLELGFDRLSTYGIIKEYTIKEIKDKINVLVAEDFLSLSGGEYPVVMLAEKGIAVLKGQEKVFQRVEKRKEKVAQDSTLFEILRKVRKQISEREKVPPYIIFSDTTLKEMSEVFPTCKEEFLNIKGVGESKFKKYGEEFSAAIQTYMSEQGLVKKVLEKQVPIEEAEEKIKSHVVTLNMYKEGLSIQEISKERGIKLITIQDHFIKCASEGLDIEWNEFIPQQYEDLILEKIREVGAEKLKPIKEALPDEVDYLAIKAVLMKYKSG